jgi:subtilisin-like proprotein convertase family protein
MRTLTLAAFFLCAFTGVLHAQVYVNGNLSTGATSSTGATAPAGFTWSEVQTGNLTTGLGANIAAGYTLADDFTVPSGGDSWAVTTLKVYGYSTNYTGSTSPFNDIRVQIFDTDPSVGTPTPVWGNLTTNVFAGSTSAAMYRIVTGGTGTARHIWEVTANINHSFAPGHYWIEWQLGTVTPGASNFTPASTVLGTTTQPGNNAKQHDLTLGTWTSVADSGPQDFHFKLNYTTSDCTGTPAPGATLSTAASVCPGQVFTLSATTTASGTGISYQWQSSSTEAGPYNDIPGANGPTYFASQTEPTYYQIVITCSGSPGTSTPILIGMNPQNECYCLAGSTDTDPDFEKIDRVVFGDLDNASTSVEGYEDFTALDPVTIDAGAPTPITITSANSYGGDQVRVWIDYNHSGSFEANELAFSTDPMAGPYTGNITIPLDATPGNTRMRIRLYDGIFGAGNDTPCGDEIYGQVEDYTINIQPCQSGEILTQPADVTINCSGTASFNVGVSGTGLTYEWQTRQTASDPWTLITNGGSYSGQGTSTLNISNVTDAMAGTQYRVAIGGACTATFLSEAASLSVAPNTPQVNPTTVYVCNGSTSPISLSTTSPYESSGTVNIPIPDNNVFLSGANTGINSTINVSSLPPSASITGLSVKLNIAHQWVGDLVIVLKAPNGQIYNLAYALTNTGGLDATTGFTNTIISSAGTIPLINGTDPWTGTFAPDNQDPADTDPSMIPLGPAGFIPTTRNISDLYSVANGDWTLALYDLYDDNLNVNKLIEWSINFTYGSPFPGVFSPTTDLFTDAAGTVPYNGDPTTIVYAGPTSNTSYTVTMSAAGCAPASVNVPAIVTNPISSVTASDVAVCEGGSASFQATVEGGPGQYIWQVSTDNGDTWENVEDGDGITGSGTTTLNLSNLTTDFDGYLFRLSAISCGTVTNSNEVELTVNTPTNVGLTLPYTVMPGTTTTISVTPPQGNGSYVWFLNGSPIVGVTGNQLTAGVDQIGQVSVQYTNAFGCVSTSEAVAVTGTRSSNLFIYPSPTNGQFSVRYYSDASTTPLVRQVNVYDSKGARVFTRSFNVLQPYQNLSFDLSGHPAGVYRVELMDRTGRRIKTGSVIKN